MASKDVFKSARLKIDRALEHIADINTIIHKERPFRLISQTNAKEGRRCTFIEADEAVVGKVSIRCGEAVMHLSSALDYAYCAVVRPRISNITPRQLKALQFPFSETSGRLKEACHNRLAHMVSPLFVDDIITLAPHGEAGGNKLLYFISTLNNPEKHTDLLPISDILYTPFAKIRQKIPDFGGGMIMGDLIAISSSIVEWRCQPFTLNEWVVRGVPNSGILKEDVDIPIDVTFQGRAMGELVLAIPTLHEFVGVVREVIKVFSRHA